MNQLITPAQMKRLHLLLNQTGLIEQKRSLIFSFSKERTESSRELTRQEADELIDWLNTNDPTDRQRKLILHFAHQMGWEDEQGKVNIYRVNEWCKKYGQFKKPLNKHTAKELPRLVTQFEAVYKSFLKSV